MVSLADETAWEAALREGAAELGLPLPESALSSYQRHFTLLRQHNARAGLTSLVDPVEIAVKHYLDSLTCLLATEVRPGEAVADLGSGGGFPGLVLAVARPEARYTLVDSSARRADFLRLAAEDLGLTNVSVITGRAEGVGRDPEHRERYDLVVSRAVASLPVLLEYGLPLARVGGRVLAMKGPEAEEEIASAQGALEVLGGRVEGMCTLSLPRALGRRALILIEKVTATPERYPRRAGIPAKRPL